MPSLRHELIAHLIPRLRGTGPLVDVDSMREQLLREDQARSRTLPTSLAPGFARRYELSRADVGFPVHVIRPRSHRPRTTLYYLHGGGFVSPIDPFHVRYVLKLARLLDAEVVLPDYPLTPEHTWRDSHALLVRDLTARLSLRDRVVVAGDSAGGGLALALTQSVRDLGGPQPSHQLLLSPWADLTTSTPATYDLADVDPWLNLTKMAAYAQWWAGGPDDLARTEVSPGLGDLSGLPPTLMFCGTRDLLVPGCRLLADRAAATDWDLTYLEAPDLIHVFPLLPIPEAGTAWRHTQTFLR